ncbi:12389_t:CDS:2, partial [Funneliformis geosporum]
MPPEPHNFRPYFLLTKNTKNKGNAIAVCLSCISNCDGGLEEAKLKAEYTIEIEDDNDESIRQLAKRRKLSTSTISSFNLTN